MKKTRRRARPYAFRALAWRVTAFVLALWLLAAGLVTWAVARDMYIQLEDRAQWYTSINLGSSWDDYSEDLPGYQDCEKIRVLPMIYSWLSLDEPVPFMLPSKPRSIGSSDWYYGKWDLVYGFRPTVIYYDYNDENKDIIISSGNWLYFPYVTEAQLDNEDTEAAGLTYVNMDALELGAQFVAKYTSAYPNTLGFATYDLPTLRLTGYFEGNEFHPVTVEKAMLGEAGQAMSLKNLLIWQHLGRVTWETVATGEAPADQELTTIYGFDIHSRRDDQSGSVTVNGVTYDTVVDLLHSALTSESYFLEEYHKDSLFESVIICYGRQNVGNDDNNCIALAIRCWPLQYAMVRLLPAYLVSLVVVGLLLWVLLTRIRVSLTRPIEMALMNAVPDSPEAWLEPYMLEKKYSQARLELYEAQNQVKQLQSALDFAEHAEENRRRLVSNIAHDLKTPLAIIHGYAEGLQAGIAGEKQEQYLATILEESERMDAMVLEMLDLSRLEAGRVRLASDRFSLLELTKSIVSKLELQAGAKQLRFRYVMEAACMVTADESRIGQAVTNLVTNAIKYAPEGSEIRIKIYFHRQGACFSIENESEPLPEEALEKVWTSFYRVDSSRTAEGHGLGLTVVKSIIDLHRGTCSVENTDTGVKFQFTLPL